MKKNYSYGSYRGRTPMRKFLTILVAVLLAVLVLAIAALIWLQDFRVYTLDGVKLVLPWMDQQTPSPTPGMSPVPPTPSPDVVVVTPEVPQSETLHAAMLPREALYDGTAQDKLSAVEAEAALFDMKGDDGTLGYVSGLELALQCKSSSADPAINAAIQALNGTEGMYTVARVSCFKDDLLSDADKSLNILTNSGYKWTDPEGLKWSSPTNETVRRYVTDICVELAKLGFDEILLDNAGYPKEGNLGYIKPGAAYDKARLATVIGDFYEEVKAALADYPDVRLAILTDRVTLETGSDERSGQTRAALAETAGRVWVTDIGAGWAQCGNLLGEAGLQDPEANLVSVADQAGPAGRSWAVWP